MPKIKLTPMHIRSFQDKILAHYRNQGRDLPWRHTTDPYGILISEVMLQQTQVPRVIIKYPEFINKFPTLKSLARASFRSVMTAWQGMGYNRRALYLHQLAKTCIREFNGQIPSDPEVLVTLPGIGKATAASIAAFAFNRPTIFIETNIRSVFIHDFFPGKSSVNDQQILPLVDATLYRRNPCRWYNALMDYGLMLKQNHGNPGKRSQHYVRQSAFSGSNRQVRGRVLRLLLNQNHLSVSDIIINLKIESKRGTAIIEQMLDEGLVREKNHRISL